MSRSPFRRSWWVMLPALLLLSGAPLLSARALPRSAAAAAASGSGPLIHWGDNTYGQATAATPVGSVMAVSAGIYHTLLLRVDGTVVALGRNLGGDCDVPPGLTGVIQVAAGSSQSFALKSNGTVVAWGTPPSIVGTVDMPSGLAGVIAISSSHNHSLALKDDGTVVAWGTNSNGESDVPAGLSNVIAIAAGWSSSLALKADGTVVSWGYEGMVPPAGLSGVMAIAAGQIHGLALKTDGTVVAWGDDTFGQATVPAELTGVTEVTAGSVFSVARRADGTVVAWGWNNRGQTDVPAGLDYVSAISAGANFCIALRPESRVRAWGNPATTNNAGVITRAASVAAGYDQSLALRSNGEIQGWGVANYGQLSFPADLGPVRSIDAGGRHSLAVKSDGTVVAVGSYIGASQPFPSGLTGPLALGSGSNHDLAVQADGTVIAWGSNSDGQLNIPAGLSGVKAVDGGSMHSVALRANGTLAAWGYSSFAKSSFAASLTHVKAIVVGEYFNMALKSDGTVVAWGDNTARQLNVPAGLTGVRSLACGYFHTVAVKDDGTIVSWGIDGHGETVTPAGLGRVTQTAAGFTQSSAVVADGAPTLTAPVSVETPEDTSKSFQFTIGDAETAIGDLTVSSAYTNPGLVQDLTLIGSGATRTVSIVPAGDQFGTATITLTVSDGISQTVKQIPLTVHPRNDPPAYVVGGDQTVDEDAGSQSVSGWATHLQAGPDNESDQHLTFHLVTNTRPELFAVAPAVDPVTGNLTYTPAANTFGTATLGFQLQDDGGTDYGGQDTDPSEVQTFQITINSVPDAPVATADGYSLWKNTGLSTPAAGVLANDTDADGETLTAVLVSSVSHGALTLNGDGSFTYTPTTGFAGPDSFTYLARDASGAESSAATVTLTVRDDTIKPTAVVGAVVSLTGPARVYVPVTVSDGQSGVASVQLTTNSSNVVLVDPVTNRQVPIGGTLTFDPALASLVVQATKINPALAARVELRVRDASGNEALVDPVVANLEVKKKQLDRTYRNLPRYEHYVTVENGTPGVTSVKLWVNGKRLHAGALADGAVLRLDAAAWMTKAKNTVRIQAEGPAGATAVLLIGDQSLAGGARTAGTLRREQLRLAP